MRSLVSMGKMKEARRKVMEREEAGEVLLVIKNQSLLMARELSSP